MLAFILLSENRWLYEQDKLNWLFAYTFNSFRAIIHDALIWMVSSLFLCIKMHVFNNNNKNDPMQIDAAWVSFNRAPNNLMIIALYTTSRLSWYSYICSMTFAAGICALEEYILFGWFELCSIVALYLAVKFLLSQLCNMWLSESNARIEYNTDQS